MGTRQGHLCMYELVRNEDQLQVQLMKYNKLFSKKAIQQLEVVPDHNLLISLTGNKLYDTHTDFCFISILDNLVQVHDLNSIHTTIHQVMKSKGATLFAININVRIHI